MCSPGECSGPKIASEHSPQTYLLTIPRSTVSFPSDPTVCRILDDVHHALLDALFHGLQDLLFLVLRNHTFFVVASFSHGAGNPETAYIAALHPSFASRLRRSMLSRTLSWLCAGISL